MAEAPISRNLGLELLDGLLAFRAVILAGARQSGKTTLLSSMPDLEVQSLDNAVLLEAAVADPLGFVEQLHRPVAIDEFQRAGESLLLAVKLILDHSDDRGQFVLSGSTNYLAQRGVSETLAGRAVRLELWPFSAGELDGVRESFLDKLFDPDAWPTRAPRIWPRSEVVERILQGGYPEVVTQNLAGRHRRLWFESYLHDVTSREALRPVAVVRKEEQLRTVFSLLAARASNELVIADLARDAGLDRDTTSSYVALLQALHLVELVPAWSNSATTRAKRHAKVLICDSGLAADVGGVNVATFSINGDRSAAGRAFENWVVTELHKQRAWSLGSIDLFHFRDRNGAEVDCIVQDRRSGRIAGVEIKLTSTPRREDARHLVTLRDRLGDRFTVGLLLHTGTSSISLGERIWAVPVGVLVRSD